MGIDAQMFVRVPRAVSDAEVRGWSYRFGSMASHHLLLGFDAEIWHRPLERVDVYEQDGDDIVPEQGETFLRVPLSGRYYGVGYERGPLLDYIGIAEMLEILIPECAVWYGGDSSGVCATPFDRKAREALLRHAADVAHDPYEGAFSDIRGAVGTKAPDCPVCFVTMPRCGWGPNYALFRCSGCGWEVRHKSGKVANGFNIRDEVTA